MYKLGAIPSPPDARDYSVRVAWPSASVSNPLNLCNRRPLWAA